MLYLELKECFYYYNEYQFMYKEVLMSGKDNKIDEQLNTLNIFIKFKFIMIYNKES